MLNTQAFRVSLMVPHQLWIKMSPELQKEVQTIRESLNPKYKSPGFKSDLPTLKTNNTVRKPGGQYKSNSDKLPSQYPSMPKYKVNAVQIEEENMELSDTIEGEVHNQELEEEVIDDNDTIFQLNMAITSPMMVKAHMEYVTAWYQQSVPKDRCYAISDSGADATIVGKSAKVLGYTNRYATIVGYNPKCTQSNRIPIVSALIKVRTNAPNGEPVLLKIHEAPYIQDSNITLLSEYQIQEHGLVIDSVASKHKSISGNYGTQRLYLNKWLHVPFEDRGGLMGFEVLPYEEGDEMKMEIHTITSNIQWVPSRYREVNSVHLEAECNDLIRPLTKEETGFDKVFYINSLKNEETVNANTVACHWTNFLKINSKMIQPYLGYCPVNICSLTLKVTTQNSKMVINRPLRRHLKPRFSEFYNVKTSLGP